jgi:hypothetical protein
MNIDKELGKILTILYLTGHSIGDAGYLDPHKTDQSYIDKAEQDIKQLFQELIDEVIGDNDKEDFSTIDSDYDYSTRNTLKAEQRKRVKEILNRK